MGRRSSQASFLIVSSAALLVASCNAAVGGGLVVLAGGAGFLAGQCYDRVRVRVRDPGSGLSTCGADVWVAEVDESGQGGSERRLRPCYSAALTAGKWRLSARQEGYAAATTELTIPKHDGACPHYTHSIELTLRHEGEPATLPVAHSRPAQASAPAAPAGAPAAGASDLESPPARLVPPPIPGGSATPVVPTRTFDPAPVAPAPTAPATPPVPPAP